MKPNEQVFAKKTMKDLTEQKCLACEGGALALNSEQIANLRPQLNPNWEIKDQHRELVRCYQFKNFYQTMAFVNALAWIAHQENHHPDLKVSYNHCEVHWTTHALQGLSMNDFICAAKTDKIIQTL